MCLCAHVYVCVGLALGVHTYSTHHKSVLDISD